eukprot:TRINITY_DN9499_c0_g1_i1.p1 TRINITY_DN9499_c0_g1~~TRINITY_DN9499_c0_g1_i1.p1  ORF type:complete len:738 (+),score=143.76 TRINITY_DN9499_c0_g1_i1:315-2216(+)
MSNNIAHLEKVKRAITKLDKHAIEKGKIASCIQGTRDLPVGVLAWYLLVGFLENNTRPGDSLIPKKCQDLLLSASAEPQNSWSHARETSDIKQPTRQDEIRRWCLSPERHGQYIKQVRQIVNQIDAGSSIHYAILRRIFKACHRCASGTNVAVAVVIASIIEDKMYTINPVTEYGELSDEDQIREDERRIQSIVSCIIFYRELFEGSELEADPLSSAVVEDKDFDGERERAVPSSPRNVIVVDNLKYDSGSLTDRCCLSTVSGVVAIIAVAAPFDLMNIKTEVESRQHQQQQQQQQPQQFQQQQQQQQHLAPPVGQIGHLADFEDVGQLSSATSAVLSSARKSSSSRSLHAASRPSNMSDHIAQPQPLSQLLQPQVAPPASLATVSLPASPGLYAVDPSVIAALKADITESMISYKQEVEKVHTGVKSEFAAQFARVYTNMNEAATERKALRVACKVLEKKLNAAAVATPSQSSGKGRREVGDRESPRSVRSSAAYDHQAHQMLAMESEIASLHRQNRNLCDEVSTLRMELSRLRSETDRTTNDIKTEVNRLRTGVNAAGDAIENLNEDVSSIIRYPQHITQSGESITWLREELSRVSHEGRVMRDQLDQSNSAFLRMERKMRSMEEKLSLMS